AGRGGGGAGPADGTALRASGRVGERARASFFRVGGEAGSRELPQVARAGRALGTSADEQRGARRVPPHGGSRGVRTGTGRAPVDPTPAGRASPWRSVRRIAVHDT